VELLEIVGGDARIDRALEVVADQVALCVGPVEQVAQRRDDAVHHFQRSRDEEFRRQTQGAERAQAGHLGGALHARTLGRSGPAVTPSEGDAGVPARR
jgi:hypothetical protein